MTVWVRRFLIMLAVSGTAPLGAAPVGATAAGDPLMEICSGFLSQNGLAVGGDAGRLCTCLVREVKGKLSKPEMETYDRQNAAGQPLPAALQNKITGIATQCLTEAR